jgi:hypothetical protein
MVESLIRVSRRLVNAIDRRNTDEVERLAKDRGLVLEHLAQWERGSRGRASVPGEAAPLPVTPEIRKQLQEDDAAIVRGLEVMKKEVLQSIAQLNQQRKMTSYMDEVQR